MLSPPDPESPTPITDLLALRLDSVLEVSYRLESAGLEPFTAEASSYTDGLASAHNAVLFVRGSPEDLIRMLGEPELYAGDTGRVNAVWSLHGVRVVAGGSWKPLDGAK